MSPDATITKADIARAAYLNLQTVLVRYHRLASPPRWTQYPVVGCIDSVERAERRAILSGNTELAAYFGGLADREYRRQQILRTWLGRSETAWVALANRLEQAIDWATRVNALAAGELENCEARLLDSRGRAEYAHLVAKLEMTTN